MQTEMTCFNCNLAIKLLSDHKNRKIKCPKCEAVLDVSQDYQFEHTKQISVISRWFGFSCISLIFTCLGGFGGFIIANQQSESKDKKFLLENEVVIESMNKKLKVAEERALLAESVRDTYEAKLTTVMKDRDAEKIIALFDKASVLPERKQISTQQSNQKTLPKIDVVYVNSVKDAIKIHENPKDYVGKKIVVSQHIAFVSGDNFRRDADTGGYLFSWHCGTSESGSQVLGNSIIARVGQLYYWCDTDTGIMAIEKFAYDFNRIHGSFHRVSMSFSIITKKIKVFGVERELYLAELKQITTK